MLSGSLRLISAWLRGTSGFSDFRQASGAVPLPNQSLMFDLSWSELDWPRGKVMLVQNASFVKP
jgi:hypothetical protein